MDGHIGESRPRVLIAEDEAVIRYTLKLVLQQQYDVVGEAADGERAIVLAHELRPDVLLLDISMPHLNGFEVARQLRERLPEMRIIIVSSHTSTEYVEAAFQIGVQGYVFKGGAMVDLPAAIDATLNGREFRPR